MCPKHWNLGSVLFGRISQGKLVSGEDDTKNDSETPLILKRNNVDSIPVMEQHTSFFSCRNSVGGVGNMQSHLRSSILCKVKQEYGVRGALLRSNLCSTIVRAVSGY